VAGPIRSGDAVVFCRPVAIAAAVARWDGRVHACGHPADHARLGVAEERLDALTGTPGVIDEVARSGDPGRGNVGFPSPAAGTDTQESATATIDRSTDHRRRPAAPWNSVPRNG